MANLPKDYNRAGMSAFVFSMVFVLAFFAYLVVVHPGVDLGEKVQDPAAAVPQKEVKKIDIATIKEPWVASEDVVTYGHEVFKANCVVCHGNEGKGDGPGGAALNPKPRNLVEGKWKQGGDSVSLFNTISGGIKGSSMPAFSQFTAADRWALVQFVRSITQNKAADDAAKVAEFAKSAK